jgi:hypothetical protein
MSCGSQRDVAVLTETVLGFFWIECFEDGFNSNA